MENTIKPTRLHREFNEVFIPEGYKIICGPSSIILELGALIEKRGVNAKDKNGRTMLHFAALGNKVKKAKYLIDNGSQVNAKDKNKNTPLHTAAIYGYQDIIKLLLDKGSEVNLKNKKGLTPLHCAVMGGCEGIVRLLLDHNAEIDATNNIGQAPLHIAASLGYRDIVRLLLDNDAEMELKMRTRIGCFPFRKGNILLDLIKKTGQGKVNEPSTQIDTKGQEKVRPDSYLISKYSKY